MEYRSSTPGKVLKALVAKYIFDPENEQPEAEKYFERISVNTHSKIRSMYPDSASDLSCA